MATDPLTLLLLPLSGIVLLVGLATAVATLVRIIRTTPDPVADALNAAEALLAGTGVTLPEECATREEAIAMIRQAARECGDIEYHWLHWEAAVGDLLYLDPATAACMKARTPLMDLASSL